MIGSRSSGWVVLGQLVDGPIVATSRKTLPCDPKTLARLEDARLIVVERIAAGVRMSIAVAGIEAWEQYAARVRRLATNPRSIAARRAAARRNEES